MEQTYRDLTTKQQVILERLKSGAVRDFTKELQKVDKLLRQALLSLDTDVGEMTRRELNQLIAQLRVDQGLIYHAAIDSLLVTSADIAALSMSQEVMNLEKTVDLRGTKLKAFTKKRLFSKVIQRPLTTSGDLLKPWLDDFSKREIRRVNGIVRAGYSQGKTNQELVRQLIGTKAARYTDGILQTTRRNASTIVRTSIQHAASTAHQETWEANQDVVTKYEYVATLDRVTSAICRTLDGQKFEFGKGPIPPVHPNCRSRTIAVLDDKYQFLNEGATRSAEFGPVDADESYYDWLKRQSKEDQVQVLGPQRAKLLRNSGMSAERFRKLQFDKNFEPLTLDEMRELEPAAFKRAGL